MKLPCDCPDEREEQVSNENGGDHEQQSRSLQCGGVNGNNTPGPDQPY